ncbi:MAG: polyprenyl synthetase family protein, partial [Pelolinea sp.]|nr:polyprenyl synthetase family protein [Pelolinea sp.]
MDDDAQKQGKRVRPLLTLLCTEGCGGDWKPALPAAVAIELIHNFSLIHDDIEDNGLIRRSKETVWVKWGLPKGLNAGDAMFASAFKVINELKSTVNPENATDAVELLSSTCFKLTAGQHLDIDFESRENVSIHEYYEMISGKTAALLACCTQMGALLGGMDKEGQLQYSKFGNELGMAFQMYDDWLGVWGDPEITGKSANSDLIEGKKSLPVLMGIEKSKRFLTRWKGKPISTDEANQLSVCLREDGVEESVKKEFHLWNQRALDSLNSLKCDEKIKTALNELANSTSKCNFEGQREVSCGKMGTSPTTKSKEHSCEYTHSLPIYKDTR